jgi:hypothetical protein
MRQCQGQTAAGCPVPPISPGWIPAWFPGGWWELGGVVVSGAGPSPGVAGGRGHDRDRGPSRAARAPLHEGHG